MYAFMQAMGLVNDPIKRGATFERWSSRPGPDCLNTGRSGMDVLLWNTTI